MKGQRVFDRIIKSEPGDNLPRGRNTTLVSRRNECLLVRCWYWSTERNKCYEEVIRLLVDEFFLSPITVVRLVQQGSKQLARLRQAPLSQYYLQLRWPQFRW